MEGRPHGGQTASGCPGRAGWWPSGTDRARMLPYVNFQPRARDLALSLEGIAEFLVSVIRLSKLSAV